MIISTTERFIKYLSPSVHGKIHDFNLLKQMFDPSVNWFKEFNIRVDSGYAGFDKIYTYKSLGLPYKKPKIIPYLKRKNNLIKTLHQKELW